MKKIFILIGFIFIGLFLQINFSVAFGENTTVLNIVEINGNTLNSLPLAGRNTLYGSYVENMGDLNGDGINDIAVGVPNNRGKGAVYIHFMNTDGTLKSTSRFDNFTKNGANFTTGDQYGKKIKNMGDLDSNGTNDIAIATRNKEYIHYLYDDGSIKETIEPTTLIRFTNTSSTYGNISADIGDLDSNGTNDIVVGTPENGGKISIYFLEGNNKIYSGEVIIGKIILNKNNIKEGKDNMILANFFTDNSYNKEIKLKEFGIKVDLNSGIAKLPGNNNGSLTLTELFSDFELYNEETGISYELINNGYSDVFSEDNINSIISQGINNWKIRADIADTIDNFDSVNLTLEFENGPTGQNGGFYVETTIDNQEVADLSPHITNFDTIYGSETQANLHNIPLNDINITKGKSNVTALEIEISGDTIDYLYFDELSLKVIDINGGQNFINKISDIKLYKDSINNNNLIDIESGLNIDTFGNITFNDFPSIKINANQKVKFIVTIDIYDNQNAIGNYNIIVNDVYIEDSEYDTVNINGLPHSKTRTINVLDTTNPGEGILDNFEVSGFIYPSYEFDPMAEVLEYNPDVIKAEYHRIDDFGNLILMDEDSWGVGGYSIENVARLKATNNEVYTTLTGLRTAVTAFSQSWFRRVLIADELTDFVVDNDITGVDVDIEQFGGWTPEESDAFTSFLYELGTRLHENGKKMIVNLPAVSSDKEADWYYLKYSDFNTTGPYGLSGLVDTYSIMTYDYMFDYGVGEAIQPLERVGRVIDYSKNILNNSKISMGINSYGYTGINGQYDPRIITHLQAENIYNFDTAVRDYSSGEMYWNNGRNHYRYVDTIGMNIKKDYIYSKGIDKISIWHVGGNKWFWE